MEAIKLEALWTYPVKSCAGISQKSVEVEKGGFRWDRQWMIVDEKGQFLTQRQLPQMALIETELTEKSLVLRIDNYAFEVPFKTSLTKKKTVKVWKSEVEALIEDELVSRQLSSFLGRPATLVRALPHNRQHHIRFADSRPIHLANVASLKALNQELAQPVTMERFRPNIVISGLGTFKEHELTSFQFGDIKVEVSKDCTRCNIINVEPSTGKRPDSEPLIKLKEIHSREGQPAFGVLLIPKTTGTLSL